MSSRRILPAPRALRTSLSFRDLRSTALVLATSVLAAGCGTTIIDRTPDPEPQETPQDLWSKRFGGAGPQVGTGIALDATGQITIAGYFGGKVDLEKGPLEDEGQTDLFLGAFDEEGHSLWSESFGGPGGDSVPGRTFVGRSAKRDITLVAPRAGAIDFGLWPLESQGNYDLVVAGLDPNGKPVYGRRFGAPERYTLPSSMAVHPNGNTVITGNFSGTVDFGTGPLVNTQPSCTACANAAFVVVLDPYGNTLWSRAFQANPFPTGMLLPQVTFDPAGNVILAGSWSGKVELGDGAQPLESTGDGPDLFLLGFGPTGKLVWRTTFDADGDAWIGGVTTDAEGHIAVTGSFDGEVAAGGAPLSAKGPLDSFVATFDPLGQPRWSKAFGGKQKQPPPTAMFDEDGTLVFVQPFAGPLDLGTGVLQGDPGASMLVARFDAHGKPLTGAVIGATPQGQLSSQLGGTMMTLDGPDRLLLTGSFGGAVDFGTGPLLSQGDQDVFLARTSF